jgi:hypothetical protein
VTSQDFSEIPLDRETNMPYMVIADGTPWMDPDGHTAWTLRDAESMADHVESLGYDVTLSEV